MKPPGADYEIRVVGGRHAPLEGGTFYRMVDLHPTRERALSLSRSWNVLHQIDRASPLAGETPDSNMLLDLSRFHDVEPTAPTADFPYPP